MSGISCHGRGSLPTNEDGSGGSVELALNYHTELNFIYDGITNLHRLRVQNILEKR